jgi:hypothetical protein
MISYMNRGYSADVAPATAEPTGETERLDLCVSVEADLELRVVTPGMDGTSALDQGSDGGWMCLKQHPSQSPYVCSSLTTFPYEHR